jgi:hypothetical protein
MVTPVIIEATGAVTKVFKKTLKAIPGKHLIDSLQKKESYTWNITQNTESTAV